MVPDFSKYAAAQLRQILGTIDGARFPDRVREIEARLDMLQQAAANAPALAEAIPVQDRSADLPILKRVGTVLMVVGAIDIAAMIYCVASGYSYPSSLNIFALVAGIFIRRGSLRASSWVRWLAWAALPAMTLMIVAFAAASFPAVRGPALTRR